MNTCVCGGIPTVGDENLSGERQSSNGSTEKTPLLGRRPTHQKTGINIGILGLGVLLIGGVTIGCYLLIEEDRPWPINFPFNLVYREDWGAIENVFRGKLLNNSKTTHVLLIQTGGRQCCRLYECECIVQDIQNDWITRENHDIPYNFLIGSDGKSYEGRGWSHQMGINHISLNQNISFIIAFIGNFTHHQPDQKQFDEVKTLINESVKRQKIVSNYIIYGIRNTTISLQDGRHIFDHVAHWKNFKSVIDVT